MPKQKSHSGARKRFKVTGTGKILREQTNMQHKFEGKTGKRKRRLSVDKQLAPGDAKTARRLLGR